MTAFFGVQLYINMFTPFGPAVFPLGLYPKQVFKQAQKDTKIYIYIHTYKHRHVHIHSLHTCLQ